MTAEPTRRRARQAPPSKLWPRMSRDRAYKAVLSNDYLLQDLLTGFGPDGLAEWLDFSTLREENPELIRGGLRARKADVLWSVRLRDGGPRIHLQIEAQHTVDAFMAARMFDLAGGIVHKAAASKGPAAKRALPAVLSMVVYSGERPWTASRDLARLVDSENETGKLDRIALWLLECDSAEDLMARIRAA